MNDAREKLVSTSRVRGRVHGVSGLTITAHVPGARRGDWLRITRADGSLLDAEVVALEAERVTLMPLGDVHGVGADDAITFMGPRFEVTMGDAWLGRVLDGMGRPLDGGAMPDGSAWPIERKAPSAFQRPRITRVLPTGVRAIDALCTVGEGQRMGLFAPAGVGKTTLLARIAAHATVDVIVIALVGERGRELRDFLDDALDPGTRARSVIVCSTSDAPALERMKCAQVATAAAEHFRSQGKRVLLLVDSLTRVVRAAREVGLAAGEPPARRGFPPSAFSGLAPLLERAGLDDRGSITAFYTVLVEGNDLDEPVADEVRGLVDGHLVLDRSLAERGHHPALDIPRSLSRLMDGLVSVPHRQAAHQVRAWLSRHADKRDLVTLGAVQPGADPLLDAALRKLPGIESLLKQDRGQPASFADTVERLIAAAR